MHKLLSVIVAAMFAAVSASAFAASHAGAQMKDEKKPKAEKKVKAEKKMKAKAEGDAKKAPKKTMKKGDEKKKDMK
jgi:Ni/Co efflux regulator RcnB